MGCSLLRWRTASNSNTAAAALVLSESAAEPRIGIETWTSAAALQRSSRPVSSRPTTIAEAVARSASV